MASSTSSHVAIASSCRLKATFTDIDTTFSRCGGDEVGGELVFGVEQGELSSDGFEVLSEHIVPSEVSNRVSNKVEIASLSSSRLRVELSIVEVIVDVWSGMLGDVRDEDGRSSVHAEGGVGTLSGSILYVEIVPEFVGGRPESLVG